MKLYVVSLIKEKKNDETETKAKHFWDGKFPLL